MKLRCIIVDDEEEAREGLCLLLQQDKSVEVIAICRNGLEAIKQIDSLQPDLVLLDIQMPEINGFEVLNSIKFQPQGVIFITAYDQFALKAFEVHAMDYLLKPFSDERFYEAIENAKTKIGLKQSEKETLSKSVEKIVNGQKGENAVLKSSEKERLTFKADGKIYFIDFQDILWFEAYDYYIKIHVDNQFYLVRDSLKKMIERLNESFVRIHKSSIVNTDYVVMVDRQPNSNDLQVVLQNGITLKVSRGYKDELLEKMTHGA